LLGKVDEIPNDQDVTDEARFLEHPELVIEALTKLTVDPGAVAVAFFQTFVTKAAQIIFARLSFRHRILRVFRFPELDREIATLTDRKRVRHRIGEILEQVAHFLRRFEIQLRFVVHAVLVLHHLAGADAKHHVVRVVIAPAQKMDVIRRNQTETELFRQLRQDPVAFVLLFHAVVVQFQEEILRAEDVAILSRGLFRLVDVVRLNGGINFAGQTSAQSDQTGGMLGEKLLVDPRRVMKAVEMRRCNQFHQIAITGLVLCQQREMIGRLARRAAAVAIAALAPRLFLGLEPDLFLGLALGLLLGAKLLLLALAVAGGFAFEAFAVGPFWNFLLRFASTPAVMLESSILEEARAASSFDGNGQGLVTIELDGQIVQILGTLRAEDRDAGIRVRGGDRLRVEEVDGARNRCTVSFLGR